jgi:hypothetical protein
MCGDSSCCPTDETCLNGSCCAVVCGESCCAAGEVCTNGVCCPPGSTTCGDACCNSSETCVNGACCANGQVCGPGYISRFFEWGDAVCCESGCCGNYCACPSGKSCIYLGPGFSDTQQAMIMGCCDNGDIVGGFQGNPLTGGCDTTGCCNVCQQYVSLCTQNPDSGACQDLDNCANNCANAYGLICLF